MPTDAALVSGVFTARRTIVLEGLAAQSLISARHVLDVRASSLDDAPLLGAAELAFAPLLAEPGRIEPERPVAAEG